LARTRPSQHTLTNPALSSVCNLTVFLSSVAVIDKTVGMAKVGGSLATLQHTKVVGHVHHRCTIPYQGVGAWRGQGWAVRGDTKKETCFFFEQQEGHRRAQLRPRAEYPVALRPQWTTRKPSRKTRRPSSRRRAASRWCTASSWRGTCTSRTASSSSRTTRYPSCSTTAPTPTLTEPDCKAVGTQQHPAATAGALRRRSKKARPKLVKTGCRKAAAKAGGYGSTPAAHNSNEGPVFFCIIYSFVCIKPPNLPHM
jgi:hypothetical protein